MEQKNVDIYEILKGMPDGTPLYTPMCGNVELTSVEEDKEKLRAIWTENKNGAYSFDKHGKWTKGGEVLLFPSKEMRDWSKFSWKKGDVLVSNDSDRHIIFKGFSKNDYTTFEGKHWISVSKKRHVSCLKMQNVQDYHIEDNKDSGQTYINAIEKRLGGKLNRETLEVEKPQTEFKDGDIVVYGKSVAICRKIYKHTLYFYVSIDETFGLLFDDNCASSEGYRFATDSEKQQLFSALEKEGKRWNPDTKQIEDLPKKCEFKPFDKVLVRNGDNSKWLPAFFIRYIEEYAARFNALPIHFGKARFFTSCIPFEGNEHLAFTDKDFKDLPS